MASQTEKIETARYVDIGSSFLSFSISIATPPPLSLFPIHSLSYFTLFYSTLIHSLSPQFSLHPSPYFHFIPPCLTLSFPLSLFHSIHSSPYFTLSLTPYFPHLLSPSLTLIYFGNSIIFDLPRSPSISSVLFIRQLTDVNNSEFIYGVALRVIFGMWLSLFFLCLLPLSNIKY
ncbi:unnamed protein product [Acanthosepion pharaonis]|uniref:Uncharacterized protein n=1 Tax=Acanthosepion pharaonis TaxID=158019 RepID=A0A812AMT6_ACAPH|nr:unnamed protein product [Sepia pharaonis]